MKTEKRYYVRLIRGGMEHRDGYAQLIDRETSEVMDTARGTNIQYLYAGLKDLNS